MNYDGHLGTLHVAGSKRKCAVACVGLDAQFTDTNGTSYPTSVTAFDDNGQHLGLSIAFSGSPQQFDLYLFSFDKQQLAGTTVWQGRTFGVVATRKAGAIATQSSATKASPRATMNAQGQVVSQQADGSTRTHRMGECGGTVRMPNGRVLQEECAVQVQPLVPPDPPASGTPQDSWLRGQDATLLTILQSLMDSTSYQNYLNNFENGQGGDVYQQISRRVTAIGEFTSPQ